MKVFEIQKFGVENLALAEREKPQPKANEVLIKMHAVSLNFRDLLMVKGQYNPRLPLPRIPVSDGAGEVVAVGENVTRVKTGDRVMGIFFQKWTDGKATPEKIRSGLGGDVDGMLAEYVALDEEGVVHIPEHLSYEEAATLPCAALTAWNALFGEGNLQAGESVLVQGTGGVSLFALQFARLAGARVVATSSNDEKLKRAAELGASDGINYKTTPDWDKSVRQLTNAEGVDYVVEVGGAGTLPKSLNAVKMGGMVSLIGVLAGGASDINIFPILMKNIRVQGIYVGSRTLFEAMNRTIAVNELKPVVDKVFPFDEAVAALQHMESGAHFGKIVVAMK
ncbi:MAG: NAD(P)-dependent alcohol dehydrogenase [Pyrinomonadaceae bacterium]